jgi:chloramphenicol O-acetyltransferase type A
MMRYIDMQTWPRRQHFELYRAFEHPHFSMGANVDLTAFYPFVKRQGYSLTVSILYVIARAANAIPEFRQRIRGEQVIEHEIVNPSFTVLTEGDLFTFCDLVYAEAYSEFAATAAKRIAEVKAHPSLDDSPGQDDVLYTTSIPWVSFTSFTHPMPVHAGDSIPRFAWGKYFREGQAWKLPLGVQGHHAVMDGFHMGRLYERVQDFFDHPEAVLGEAEGRGRGAAPLSQG